LDLLSLIVLCATIIAAFIFKINTGLAAIAVSLILSWIAGIPGSVLIASFNNSLYLMLLGVMYLFCIAQENRTLEVLARKAVVLCKGRIKLIPLILFAFSAIISAIGPGLISTTALISVLGMALAIELKVDPISLLIFGALGAFAGGLSPITPSGIVAVSTAAENGITGIDNAIAIKMFLVMSICAVGLYFFVFKWHKYEFKDAEMLLNTTDKPDHFKKEHIYTLIGLIAVSIMATVFNINVGLAAFSVAVILTILGVADESAALKKVPWGTLVMITGVGILISLVTELGGIDLLSDLISSLMGPKTASAIMTVLAGVMSWVSSASGVVMPTLIPTAPTLAATISNVNAAELVAGICIGANVAAFSPLSSCGALILAAYSSSDVSTTSGRNKMFTQLFCFSAVFIAISALFALFGFMR